MAAVVKKFFYAISLLLSHSIPLALKDADAQTAN